MISLLKDVSSQVEHRILVLSPSQVQSTNSSTYPSIPDECTETEVLEGETCVVVEGAYRVYFEDGAVGSSNTMAYMEGQVAEGMESDSFVGGDILKVTWMDSVEGPTTEDLPSGADSVPVRPANNEVRSGSTPAIVGASVGGILGIGLLAFYRRRSVKATDDDTFTTPAGNNSMG